MKVETYLQQSRTLLEQCEEVFKEYGRLHRAKGTLEGDAKAVRNERMATRIRDFLDTPDGAPACQVLGLRRPGSGDAEPHSLLR